MKDIFLDNINLSFGEKPIFQNFSVQIPHNKVVYLLGPSGCGKTTMLRLILGLQKPDSGDISVPKKIASVFQEYRLFPWMTAVQNIMAVMDYDTKTSIKIAQNLLNELGFEQKEFNLFPKQMSGGMKQRVSIARALAYNPDYLILDEPFSGIDAHTKKICFDVIKNYCNNIGILVVSHDMKEANNNADLIFTAKPNPFTIQKNIK